MPSFEISVDSITFEFEVFCGSCGAGLCQQSDTRESKNRRTPQVTVDACVKCLESAEHDGRIEAESEFAEEREDLLSKISELEKALMPLLCVVNY